MQVATQMVVFDARWWRNHPVLALGDPWVQSGRVDIATGVIVNEIGLWGVEGLCDIGFSI